MSLEIFSIGMYSMRYHSSQPNVLMESHKWWSAQCELSYTHSNQTSRLISFIYFVLLCESTVCVVPREEKSLWNSPVSKPTEINLDTDCHRTLLTNQAQKVLITIYG